MGRGLAVPLLTLILSLKQDGKQLAVSSRQYAVRSWEIGVDAQPARLHQLAGYRRIDGIGSTKLEVRNTKLVSTAQTLNLEP
jgi:hypothetical protein